MELRDLRMLVQVIESKGVTRAAQELHVVQSAASQSIARLERECGIALFERQHVGLRPNAAGLELAERARAILRLVADAEQAMARRAGEARTTILIGLVPSLTPLVLPDLLRVVRTADPTVEVHVEEGLLEEVLHGVAAGRLDIAVIWTDGDSEGPAVEGLLPIPLAIVMAADHPLAGQSRLNVAQLRHEPWITFPQGGPGRRWVETACCAAGFAPLVRAEVLSMGEVNAFVQAGLGITMLPPASVASEVRAGLLAAVPVDGDGVSGTLGWIVRTGELPPAIVAVRASLNTAAGLDGPAAPPS